MKQIADGDMPCLCFEHLSKGYASGAVTPTDVLRILQKRIGTGDRHRIWIEQVVWDLVFEKARSLEIRWRELDSTRKAEILPLYGLPFAVKDNIDVAGMTTTAACPGFAYEPDHSAQVVLRLENAGAILIGKTNMDQFATGLTGTRSPYGECRNAFNMDYISGGSSAGSAVAVALGMVSFSLGTDTAGSGRVPASLNNIVGLKPTRGMVSTDGVVPACRSLDCVSIFAHTCQDASAVMEVIGVKQGSDGSRCGGGGLIKGSVKEKTPFTFAVPEEMEFFGDSENEDLYKQAIQRMLGLGGTMVRIDYSPLRQAAELLYDGPWVAERFAALGHFMSSNPEDVNPVVRQIIMEGERYSAVDLFNATYQLQDLKQRCEEIWRRADVLLLPTAATTFTISEVAADPVETNKRLGYYTNFVNLMNLAAVAVPSAMRSDGLPFGVSLIAPASTDQLLLELGSRYHCLSGTAPGTSGHLPSGMFKTNESSDDGGIDGQSVRMAVVGAHLTGLELNYQLTDLGAKFHGRHKTAPIYKLYRLPDTIPPKPGLIRFKRGGASVEVEIWELSTASFGAFVANIPSPLGIGTIQLENGQTVKGFICESQAVESALDITSFGGWRQYLDASL